MSVFPLFNVLIGAEAESEAGFGFGSTTGIGADRYVGAGRGVVRRVGRISRADFGLVLPAIACSSGTGGRQRNCRLRRL